VPKSVPSRIKHRLTRLVRPAPGGTTLAEIATGLTLPRGWNQAAVLRRADAELTDPEPGVVVAITKGRPAAVGRLLGTRFPTAEVHVLNAWLTGGRGAGRTPGNVRIHAAPNPRAMHTALLGIAAPQALLDLGTATKPVKAAAFEQLIYHLADGGRYLLAGTDEPDDAARAHGASLRPMLAELVKLRDVPPPRRLVRSGPARTTAPVPDEPVRARAVRDVREDGPLIVVTKAGRQAVKLRDSEVEVALGVRKGEAWGRRLDTRPPVSFAARASRHANEQLETFRATIEVPELYLREFRDVTCAPRGLVVQDDAVLPLSFHHGHKRRLEQVSPYVRHGGDYFVELDERLQHAAELPGVFYHLDSEYPGHFGHVISEDISKLWGWERARAAYPGIKLLLSARGGGTGPKPYQLALLRALGIPDEDVTCIDAPVRVELLVGASQMFYNGRYAHPELVPMWDRMREALRPAEPTPGLPRRLFVDRPPDGLRPCRNGAQVVDTFREHGFHVIRPEELGMAAQVELFAGAEVVAGFGGSGLFNTIYAERPVRQIVIASTTYRARNEWTISATKGGEYHHFFGPAELTDELLRAKGRGFQAPFTFDFARDGAALRALLTD